MGKLNLLQGKWECKVEVQSHYPCLRSPKQSEHRTPTGETHGV